MSDPFTTLTNLIASLGNVQSVSVLKERLALVVDQLALANKEVAQLREENARISRELEQTKKELAAERKAKQFFDYRGALWRRDLSGRYERIVYCPKCQISTSAFPPVFGHFICNLCHWESPFAEQDLPGILSEIEKLSSH